MIGGTTESWGTTNFIGKKEWLIHQLSRKRMILREGWIKLNSEEGWLKKGSLEIRPWCHTLPKDFELSRAKTANFTKSPKEDDQNQHGKGYPGGPHLMNTMLLIRKRNEIQDALGTGRRNAITLEIVKVKAIWW